MKKTNNKFFRLKRLSFKEKAAVNFAMAFRKRYQGTTAKEFSEWLYR